MTKEKPICCFCGEECENEFGNNPYPVNKDENARCCDMCNMLVVLPTRLIEAAKANKENKTA